jgi:hypothetical protein
MKVLGLLEFKKLRIPVIKVYKLTFNHKKRRKVMEKSFRIDNEEIERLEFSCRFITDRQERPSYGKYDDSGKFSHYEEPYNQNGRLDMYWINVSLYNENLGPVCIDPFFFSRTPQNPAAFIISKNHNQIIFQNNAQSERFYSRVREFFVLTPEYQNQIRWVSNLILLIEEDKKSNFQERKVENGI